MTDTVFSLDQFTTLVEGLDHPEGVAWGADGNWYAGGEAGQVYRISTDGVYSQIASTGGFVLGLALDGEHNIYACDLFENKVFKISAAGDVAVYSEGSADKHRFWRSGYEIRDLRQSGPLASVDDRNAGPRRAFALSGLKLGISCRASGSRSGGEYG